jgi:glycosyltransferase involved in cell wall biosynthesis
MRIALNLLYLIPNVVGGTQTYAHGLLSGLSQIDNENEYIVFMNQEATGWLLPGAPNILSVICPVSGINRVNRYMFEQLRFPHLLKEYGADIVHSLGYVAPLFPPCSSVVTVHDLNYHAFGDQMPLLKRLGLSFFVNQSAHRADHVITISEFSRAQIISILGIPSGRITVTLQAASKSSSGAMAPIFALQHFEIQKPYIAAFCGGGPNKNISRLVRSFLLAHQMYCIPHQLVLIGVRPEYMKGEISDLIIFTGFVEESIKKRILSEAEMLVFPSTYEGFGLPVLEAQEAGVPVVCTMAASLPEVAGDSAYYFDPTSVDEMAKAIGKVAQSLDLRELLRQKGLDNVGRFSWKQTAQKTIQVYQDVYSGKDL